MQGPVPDACSPALFFFLQTCYAFIFFCSLAALFKRPRSPPGNNELTLEHSIRHKTAKAGISLILLLPTRRRKTSHKESARLSKILSNQQDSSEPARFSRTSKILSNRSDSPSRIPASESSGHSATASTHRAISPHSFPQLRDSVVSPHPPSRDSLGSFGFVGIDRVGPGPLFIDCSLDVLCPSVGLLVYGHRPFSLCPWGLFVYVVDAYGPYLLSLRALAFILRALARFC